MNLESRMGPPFASLAGTGVCVLKSSIFCSSFLLPSNSSYSGMMGTFTHDSSSSASK
jgi:hypothetical protein